MSREFRTLMIEAKAGDEGEGYYEFRFPKRKGKGGKFKVPGPSRSGRAAASTVRTYFPAHQTYGGKLVRTNAVGGKRIKTRRTIKPWASHY